MNGLPDMFAEIRYRLGRGPISTWFWVTDRLRDAAHDRRFGIFSSKRQGQSKLGFSSREFSPYQATSYPDLYDLFRSIHRNPNDVFLDYGAGMGRVVCIAATYAFRSVIGIEMSSELCEIARRNVELVRGKLLCQDVRILNCDAAEYELPGDASIIYLFNPFGGSVLSQVLRNIRQSLARNPRNLRLIFHGTLSTDHFRREAAHHPWLTLQAQTVLRTGTLALTYSNSAQQ